MPSKKSFIKGKFKKLLKDESAFFDKNKLVTAASLVAAASLSMLPSSASITGPTYAGGTISASHSSHGSHSSHASHSTHATHSTHSSHTTHSTHSSHSSHSSGCPFVGVWDGSKFMLDNNILPLSEFRVSDAEVVEDLYVLESAPKELGREVVLKIEEFENEHSFFHGVELLKATHGGDRSVGVSDGEAVEFRMLEGVLEEANRNGESFREGLVSVDDETVFEGAGGDALEVSFRIPEGVDRSRLRLVLRSGLRARPVEQPYEMKLRKDLKAAFKKGVLLGGTAAALAEPGLAAPTKSILINVSSPTGDETIRVVHPRERASFNELVDISKFIEKSGDRLKLKLDFTRRHSLTFVGLVEELGKPKLKKLDLVELKHSSKDYKLSDLGERPLELLPEENLVLKFRNSENSGKKETLLLRSRGYYVSN